jgi:hypothetical protein
MRLSRLVWSSLLLFILFLYNGVQYTPEKGKVSLDVVLCPSTNGHDLHRVEFRISDTGVGMASHTQSLLFEPFIRGKEPVSSKTPNGTGLGLVISQPLVELMSGNIKVASTIGVGTQVSIQIPFCESTAAQSQSIHLGSQAASSASFSSSANQYRVFVVVRFFFRLSLCVAVDDRHSRFTGGRSHQSAHHMPDVEGVRNGV